LHVGATDERVPWLKQVVLADGDTVPVRPAAAPDVLMRI
jgi:hypothetical protein